MKIATSLEEAGAESDPVFRWLAAYLCHRVGKHPWQRVRKLLNSVTVDTQRRDGHACCLRGSWDPGKHASTPGGRVAATAVCALSLNLFYSYDRVFSGR